ncbi:unnamed protein product [Meganyctiphanes norvegica]|uniref:Uncharacterized protein n=1 Tax=Meganyctiphanes norvegica TaxID=48144 RepID=A0AAV2RD05_MEGNR
MSAAAIILLASVLSAEAVPFLELYTLTNSGGAMLNISDYNHNLETVGFDNMIQSICGQGVWLLYEDRDYNGHSENDWEHWTEMFMSGERGCHNLPVTHHGELTSLRYAGPGELAKDSLTLYHGFNWDGAEALFLKDEDNLSDMNNEPSSLVITGCTPWTLYQHYYYEGYAICAESWPIGNGICAGAYDLTDIGMPNNALSSIRRGCYADKTIKPKRPF